MLDQSGNSHAEFEKFEITNKNGNWALHYLSDSTEGEDTFVIEGYGDTGHKIQIIGWDGDKKTEVVNNVQLNICDCPSDSNGTAYCNVSDAIIGPAKGGFPWWAGLIIGLVCILLVIATLLATRSNGVKSDIEEKPFLDYEDDVTDGMHQFTVRNYYTIKDLVSTKRSESILYQKTTTTLNQEMSNVEWLSQLFQINKCMPLDRVSPHVLFVH